MSSPDPMGEDRGRWEELEMHHRRIPRCKGSNMYLKKDSELERPYFAQRIICKEDTYKLKDEVVIL